MNPNLRDRVAEQCSDEARPGHGAALADAQLAVVALAPREHAALPVESQRRPRAAHERQHGRLSQRVDRRRHHARQEVAAATAVHGPVDAFTRVMSERYWQHGGSRAHARTARAGPLCSTPTTAPRCAAAPEERLAEAAGWAPAASQAGCAPSREEARARERRPSRRASPPLGPWLLLSSSSWPTN